MTPFDEAIDEKTPIERLEQLAGQSIEIARLVATNIAAPPELLAKLYQQQDSEVKKALVLNPNTPTEILMELGVDYPNELLTNPVLSKMLLENPNLYVEMPVKTLMSLLGVGEFEEKWGQFVLTHRFDKDFLIFVLKNRTNLWNQWRKSDTEKKIDLSGANLSGAKLLYADLSKVDLRGANLSYANLHRAILTTASMLKPHDANKHAGNDLSEANLRGADLSQANLNYVTLTKADLREAELWQMYLNCANLSEANLSKANLYRANLYRANLSEANLSKTTLYGARLSYANLSEADLRGANLSDADLRGANLIEACVKGTHFANNQGISEPMKKDLIERGAIFQAPRQL